MKRVLQAMAGAQVGGAEAFFERLVPALDRAGVSQRVLTRGNPLREEMFARAGIEPVLLPFGGMLDFWTRHRFAAEIRSFKPDVVLTWMNRATAFCPRTKPEAPFVHLARLGGYYDLKYYRHCDHLIGNTEDICRYIGDEGWPAERTHYVPNFVDETPARPVDRASLQTPDGATLLLGLGRLHKNKAFDVLIRAVSGVPEAYLWLAGSGPEQDALAMLVQGCGIEDRVRFLGWRRDTAALLAAADVLVCPSRHEPLGNVVIEGWAHNTPVIAARSQGPARLIEDGETGLLVEIDDSYGLAASIAKLSRDWDLRGHLINGGRQAFEASYREDAVVKRYIALFDQVAG